MDYMIFDGHDRLELYINVDGQMEFCQEFGSINTLSDKDVRNLADFCLEYLRYKDSSGDVKRNSLLAIQRYRRWRYEIQGLYGATDRRDIVL